MRIAALVKQIPAFEEMTLGPDGRLVREGLDLELNAYCRRAVSKAVELVETYDGGVTIITLGPPAAEDALREAIAWGLERGVQIDGVLVSDPAFAGSDTLATARAMAATIRHLGPFDLVLTGRNSVDADTGQVPPEVAEMLDLPFAGGVKQLAIENGRLVLGCEHDDGWMECTVHLPALLSCAERLCDPAKVPPEGRAAVPSYLIRTLTTADLGDGPWGQEGSPTWVGATRHQTVERAHHFQADAPLDEQVRTAVRHLVDRDALHSAAVPLDTPPVTSDTGGPGPVVAVVCEPDRERHARELIGAAADLAAAIGGSTAALTLGRAEGGGARMGAADECARGFACDAERLGGYGADHVLRIVGAERSEAERSEAATGPPASREATQRRAALVAEDVSRAVTDWVATLDEPPWAILTGSTIWGREVASRAAVRLHAGLTGDAVDLEVGADGRLVAWKPAFGGQLVAAVTATSPVQLATVRAGVLTARPSRAFTPSTGHIAITPRRRVTITAASRDDDLDLLAEADTVVGIGRGVKPHEYDLLAPLTDLLGAQLAATRKVTDEGWMPRSRQVGITGRSIAPRLFVSIGASGKFNHTVGVRAAGTVLAINPDTEAPIWQHADVGIVGDWHDVLPLLVRELRSVLTTAG